MQTIARNIKSVSLYSLVAILLVCFLSNSILPSLLDGDSTLFEQVESNEKETEEVEGVDVIEDIDEVHHITLEGIQKISSPQIAYNEFEVQYRKRFKDIVSPPPEQV